MQACHFIKDKCPRRAETANALACHLLRKSSRVTLVEVRGHATESLGLLPRPHLGFIPCGFASYGSWYHEGWVFNPPKIRRLEQHDVKQNPGATRPVSD